MKLEQKHLASYLPYELKLQITNDKSIMLMHGLSGNSIVEAVDLYDTEIFLCLGYVNTKIYKAFKLILRPLSDLTKEIEVKGKRFVPMDYIQIYPNVDYLICQIATELVEVIVYQMLLKWHFDIYGLIEAGLAIDINTLP